MSDRDLLEKLLAAQVLTLAAVMREEDDRLHRNGGDRVAEAARQVAKRQGEVIRLFLPQPPADAGTAGS